MKLRISSKPDLQAILSFLQARDRAATIKGDCIVVLTPVQRELGSGMTFFGYRHDYVRTMHEARAVLISSWDHTQLKAA